MTPVSVGVALIVRTRRLTVDNGTECRRGEAVMAPAFLAVSDQMAARPGLHLVRERIISSPVLPT